MDGSSPDASASRGRKGPLGCCGGALSHERQHAMMPWEVLIWSVVSLFSSAKAKLPCVQTNM